MNTKMIKNNSKCKNDDKVWYKSWLNTTYWIVFFLNLNVKTRIPNISECTCIWRQGFKEVPKLKYVS